jgi:hypothetical protein
MLTLSTEGYQKLNEILRKAGDGAMWREHTVMAGGSPHRRGWEIQPRYAGKTTRSNAVSLWRRSSDV